MQAPPHVKGILPKYLALLYLPTYTIRHAEQYDMVPSTNQSLLL